MEVAVNAYTIDSHPDKEAVFEWVRDNWHDLADHDLEDIVQSLKALADHTGGTLDYCVSAVPDRGEFIRLSGFNQSLLNKLNADDCPLTGMWSDYCVIKSAQHLELESVVLGVCHDCGEFRYSDEGLEDFLSMNEYLFLEDGRIL